MYVAAKRKLALQPGVIQEAIDASLGDTELGLLVWTLGVLGEWDALIQLHGHGEKILRARMARYASH